MSKLWCVPYSAIILESLKLNNNHETCFSLNIHLIFSLFWIFSTGPDNENDRSFPTISNDAGFRTPQTKKTVPTNRSPLSNGSLVTTAKKGSPQSRNERSDTTKLTKLDHRKPADWKIEIKMPNSPSSKVSHTDDIVTSDFGDGELGKNERNGNSMAENKRVLFSRTCDEKAYKFGGLRSRSQVVPFDDENYDSDVVVSNPTEEVYESPKDAEDLSLIRAQLLQIENQQANLFDLLQVMLLMLIHLLFDRQ